MAIGALIPLLFGGAAIKNNMDNKRDERERLARVQAFNTSMGSSPNAANLFNTGQMQNISDQDPGSGLLGTVQDPRIRAQFEAARNMFGTVGGQEQGQSMLRDALAFQDAGRRQTSLFEEQRASQARSFTQQDSNQENQFENSNAQAQAQLDQTNLHHRERINEQRRAKSEEMRLAQVQNSVNGIPAGDKTRVALEGGGWVDVPRYGSQEYKAAEAKINVQEDMITNLDNMTELFKDTGSFTVGEKSGKLKTMYAAAKLNMKEIFRLGVLSESDEKLIEELIQDPQSIGGQLTSNDSMQAGYEEAMRMLQSTLRNSNQEYELWGLGSELDKTTPSQIRAQNEQAKIDKQRLDAGLTPGRAPLTSAQNQAQNLRDITDERFNLINSAGDR